MEIPEKIILTANSFIGKEEVRGNLGFIDEQFEEMMKAVGWKKKQAWCAYFCELVWKLAFVNQSDTVRILNKLFSGSAVKTWYNFLDSPWITNYTPSKGSLAVWQTYKNKEPHWSGHIAIVTDFKDNKQMFTAVEGNTNNDGGREGYMVAEKRRIKNFHTESGLRLLGFIHPEMTNNNDAV